MSQPVLKVMISSTSYDLPQHRKAVVDAILRAKCFPLAMEQGTATPDITAIPYSRKMVDECDVYLGIFGHRYGTIIDDKSVNPQRWSVTEHEYRYALELDRPQLIFLMSDNHPVIIADIDTDPEKTEPE